jgi:hypothetical protein
MNGAKVVAALTRAIESSRPATAEADAAVAGAGVGADPARAARWFHTLVAMQNGGGDGCGEGFDPSGLAGSELKPQRLESYTGRAERHGFEYYRHATLSLFAALNPQSSVVIGQNNAASHQPTLRDFSG